MTSVRNLLDEATNGQKRKRRHETENDVSDNQHNDNAEEPQHNAEEPQHDAETYAEFVEGKSQKRGIVLWHEGYRFCKTKKRGNKIDWECDHLKSHGCPVRARTTTENIANGNIYPNNQIEAHNHLPNPAKMEKEQRLQEFKRRVREEPEVPTSDLVGDLFNAAGVTDEIFAQMPTEMALKQFGAKHRRAFGHALNNNNVEMIEIPEQLRNKRGQRFLIYDSNDHRPAAADRVLVFASVPALDYLRQHRHWSVDATFQTCPRVFGQLSVIGFFIRHKMFPCVHALMPQKTRQQYLEVIKAVRQALGNGHEPHSIMTDFESAEMAAFAELYPGLVRKGCLFHLGQNFLKRIRKTGLIRRFKDDRVRCTFRWCISLAFLPPAQVRKGLSLIIEHAADGMEEFLYYVAKNYVGLTQWERDEKMNAFRPVADADRMLGNVAVHSTPQTSSIDSTVIRSLLSTSAHNNTVGTSTLTDDFGLVPLRESSLFNDIAARLELPLVQPPKFGIELWNVRDRVIKQLPRCQASMEATHLSLQKQSKRRPRMHDFLSTLHKFDDKKIQEIREAVLKPESIKRRREYIQMDTRLQHLVNNVALETDQSIRTFLQAVSLALQNMEGDLVNNEQGEESLSDDDGNDENLNPINLNQSLVDHLY